MSALSISNKRNLHLGEVLMSLGLTPSSQVVGQKDWNDFGVYDS